jgi:hypothetical protein
VFRGPMNLEHRAISHEPPKTAELTGAARPFLSRSVQRPKGARLSAMLDGFFRRWNCAITAWNAGRRTSRNAR